LAHSPADVRVSAWVKPFVIFKSAVNPAYAWEPILWRGGRRPLRGSQHVRDWVSAALTPFPPDGGRGYKPEAVCWWLFQLLGLEPDDEFVDVFPGTGMVTRTWAAYRRQRTLPFDRLHAQTPAAPDARRLWTADAEVLNSRQEVR
jgi:hypothetical protein